MLAPNWRGLLDRDGLLICDDIFSRPLFDAFDQAVRRSWHDATGWQTRVKGAGVARAIPLQSAWQMSQIDSLLKAYEATHSCEFTYLYHALHESRDQNEIIRTIGDALIRAWHCCVVELVPSPYRTNFSLTAFTQHCQLKPHTDHSSGSAPYRLTLLLYLSGGDIGLAPLEFEFKGRRSQISALPNRSVLFVPSDATNHWVEPLVSNDPRALRLAFSGWLF